MLEFEMVLGNNVMVEFVRNANEHTSTLAVLSTKGKDKVTGRDGNSGWYGIVRRFGIDSKLEKDWDLKEGDIVLCSPEAWDVDRFEHDGKKFYRVMDDFIIGKYDGKLEDLLPKSEIPVRIKIGGFTA